MSRANAIVIKEAIIAVIVSLAMKGANADTAVPRVAIIVLHCVYLLLRPRKSVNQILNNNKKQ